jgi:hypothetical protein
MEEKEQEDKPTPTFLEQVKLEKEALEKVKNEVKETLKEIRELRAEEIMSGQTDAGSEQEKPKEISNSDYMKSVMAGNLNEKK